MVILEQIDLAELRSEPRVWVSKLALFESLDPLTPIREPITFTTGLNIVWGVENEANDEQFEPGHGVGKTTLCRLIRYCLGEPGFGQAHAVTEIQFTFPDGCVAAEVQIDGRRWAVLRPFNKSRADWARLDTTIKELIENHPTRESFQEYLAALSKTCLSGIKSEEVLIGGESITWTHLLAMCTRDQEARYQSLWQWRSPRSDSVPRNIQKDDAHLTLRSVLNLLPDEETELQKKLAGIDTELSHVEKDIAERQREPDYWTRHYRRVLHDEFSIEDALQASLESRDMFSLPALVKAEVKELQAKHDKAHTAIVELDRKIQLTAASLQDPADLQKQQLTAAEVKDAGTDTLTQSLEELRQLRKLIQDMEHGFCKYGEVSIGSCQHAQSKLVELDQQIREVSQATLPKAAKRDRVSTQLRAATKRRSELIKKLMVGLETLNKERQKLDDERRKVSDHISRLQRTINSLVDWETLRTGRETDSELATLEKRKKTLERNQKTTKQQLSELLASQDKSLKKLRRVYEALARSALSQDFNGRVQLSSEGLEFRVFRGENLSGEAFETLSILLADIAVLAMGAIGTANHPGILIHDSPREADLGGHIYRRLLLCVSELASEVMRDDTVPFQYIVTTTTPPPSGLRKKAVTRLKLGGEEGQLFGKQLHATSGKSQQELPMSKSDDETGGGK